MNTQGQIVLHPQEFNGNYKFSGRLYLTAGFKETFKDMASIIAVSTLLKILDERVHTYGADYLQAASHQGITFWAIDDVTHVTFLLPAEY
jgi:hypothetical protein